RLEDSTHESVTPIEQKKEPDLAASKPVADGEVSSKRPQDLDFRSELERLVATGKIRQALQKLVSDDTAIDRAQLQDAVRGQWTSTVEQALINGRNQEVINLCSPLLQLTTEELSADWIGDMQRDAESYTHYAYALTLRESGDFEQAAERLLSVISSKS